MKNAIFAVASLLVAMGLFPGSAVAHAPPGFLHIDAKAGCVFGNAPHHWFKVSPGGLFFGLVFETDNMDAPAVAIEIAVTQEAYDKLPDHVKKFYHNHADEIAMGDVTAPDLPPAEAKGTLEFLATTYGRMIIISEIADLAPIERTLIPTDPQSFMGTFWSYTP
ncbi:MAG: DUF1264 domain-containing protein [Alphaproteobacteria bacterium]|nr:DUF1264 domain-containing protein [Alphaproteobacteria bacterium]